MIGASMATRTAENIEAQVIELVTQMAEVTPERVTLTARLLDDLGIDGDDAVELFDGVHERFGTDLTHLYEEWNEHFGPEGMPSSTGLVIIPAAVAGGFAFSILNDFVGDVVAGVVGVVAAAAVVVASIWIGRKAGFIEDVTPITVGEVVRAVQAGAWPRSTQ
jgi:acyl carrier protein